MSGGGSRRRALLFVVLATGCALASVALASRYRDSGAVELGASLPVVVVERELPAGEEIERPQAREALTVREVPARFVPPDALGDPAEALGSRPQATVPAGSYLLGSHLATGSPESDRLAAGLRPIDITVADAEALQPAASAGSGRPPLVDVVAADEPGSTVNPRVRVLAREAPLLGLARRRSGAVGEGRAWQATLGLSRRDALRVIEAENFAREVRLLPRGGGS